MWTHQTDALGFRNQPLSIPADIVLLGDSYIYGHGVDFESTVSVILAQLTGLSVDNLARQGDCTLQQAYLITEFLPLLRPRYVFYFFFENDLADLHVFLNDAAMQAFIDQPLESFHYAHRLDPAQALREREGRLGQRSVLSRLQRRTSTAHRAGSGGNSASGRRWPDRQAWRGTSRTSRRSPGVTRRRLSCTCARSRAGTTPVSPLSPSRPPLPASGILRRFAAPEGIDFIDTSAVTMADASLWLPRDGHLSPAGARRFAELAAAYVATHPTARRPPDDSAAGSPPPPMIRTPRRSLTHRYDAGNVAVTVDTQGRQFAPGTPYAPLTGRPSGIPMRGQSELPSVRVDDEPGAPSVVSPWGGQYPLAQDVAEISVVPARMPGPADHRSRR